VRQSELLGRQITERTVRPFGLVLDTPSFNQASCMAQRDKPVLIQEFVTEAPVEAFDVRILYRLAWPDER
jgi:hypothetical protein